jgi:iron complex outermembrane receptor protein
VSYSIALFQADIRDALVPYELAAPRSYYRNAQTSRNRGVELGADAAVLPGLDLSVAWTYSDFRYRHYTFTTGTPPVTHVADGRQLPGVPRQWLHFLFRAKPGMLRGGWLEVQQTYSSDYLLSDTLSIRSSPWWSTDIRAGWEGRGDQAVGGGEMRLAPFIGINNAFNHLYVGSVVINAARGRFYEPAPGRNMYVGLSIGAGR